MTTLLSEIRALVSNADKPITLIAVPRWAALHLGRERAAELGTRLVQAHADSLRYNESKPLAEQSCVMWLPDAAHPFGGCFILAHPSFEAGLLIAYAYREPLLHPHKFKENLRFGPLVPWSANKDYWFKNPSIAERMMGELAKEAAIATRKTPSYVHPSPFLIQVINDHVQDTAEETTTQDSPETPQ